MTVRPTTLWPLYFLIVLAVLLHQIRSSKPASSTNHNDQSLFPPRGLRNERAIDLQKKPFTLSNNYSAANARRRCQYNNGTLWPSASMCEDELGAEACDSIFSQGQPRSILCHNPAMSDLVRRCARTCKVCCELQNFNCKDSAAGLIDCSQHKEKCYDPAWYKVMMSTCEQTCGFCGTEKCFDAADGCWSLRALCNQPQFSDIMRHQCTKACGKCSTKGGGVGGIVTISPSGVAQQLASREQPFVIASTARPFVFTPPTPPAVVITTPKPAKEIVVVVRPNPKKCFDKSVTCSLHKNLCDNSRYADLLADRCAKTCNFCDRSVPLVEIQESGKSGEDRPVGISRGPFTRPRHADHGYYRRLRTATKRREAGPDGREAEPEFTFSGDPIEEESGGSSGVSDDDDDDDERNLESLIGEEDQPATTSRPIVFRKYRPSERAVGEGRPAKDTDRHNPNTSVTQIILNASGSGLAGSIRSRERGHNRYESRLERLLQLVKSPRLTSDEGAGIKIRRFEDAAKRRRVMSSSTEEPVDYAKMKLVVPPKLRTQEAEESAGSSLDNDEEQRELDDSFQLDQRARPLQKPRPPRPKSRVSKNEDDTEGNGKVSPESSMPIDEGNLERLIEEIGWREKAKVREAKEQAGRSWPQERPQSQLSKGNESKSSIDDNGAESGGEREKEASDFSRPDEESDEVDSEGSLSVIPPPTTTKHRNGHGPTKTKNAITASSAQIQREEHRSRSYGEERRRHRRLQQQQQKHKLRRLRLLREEQSRRGRVVKKIHKGIREFIKKLRTGGGREEDDFRRKKREASAFYGSPFLSALGYAPTEGTEEVQPIEEERVSERLHPLYQRRMIAEYPEQLLSNGTQHYVGTPLTSTQFQMETTPDSNALSQPSSDVGARTIALEGQIGQAQGPDAFAIPPVLPPTDAEDTFNTTQEDTDPTLTLPQGDDLTELIEAQGQETFSDGGLELQVTELQSNTLPPIQPILLLDPIESIRTTFANAANDHKGVDFGWDSEAQPFRGRPIPVSNKELEMLKSIEEEARRLNIHFKKSQLPKPAVLPPLEVSADAASSGSSEEGEEGDQDSEDIAPGSREVKNENDENGEKDQTGGVNLVDLISRQFNNSEGAGNVSEASPDRHHKLTPRAGSTDTAAHNSNKEDPDEDQSMDPLEAYFQEFPMPRLTEDFPPEEKLLVEGLAGKTLEPISPRTEAAQSEGGNYEARKAPEIEDDHRRRPLELAESPRQPPAKPSNSPISAAGRPRAPVSKRRRFDGVLRDRQGKPFNKSQLDIRRAIEKIKDVYDVISSSGDSGGEDSDSTVHEEGTSLSNGDSDLRDYSDEERTYEYAHRARHRPRHGPVKERRGKSGRRRHKPRPRHQPRYDDSSSSGSSSDTDSGYDDASAEANILSKERKITKELKAILRELISLKRSHYKGRSDEAHADLKRFLIERRNRRRKLALLKQLNGGLDESAALGDGALVGRGARRAVILLDANRGGNGGRRRYDPLTGGFIYDAPGLQEYAAGPVDLASDRYRAGLIAEYGDAVQVGPAVQRANLAYFPPSTIQTPVRYATGPTVRLVAAQGGPIAAQPRIIGTTGVVGSPTSNTLLRGYVASAAGNGGTTMVYGSQQPAMTLQNSGGFTHVDVGTGFGPIPPELCKDYYPYCQQITPNGFCTSAFYPLKMKREFCPHSCNLC